MRTFFQVHIDQPPGDVLIFLPGRLPTHSFWPFIELAAGQEDIESLEKSITFFAKRLPVDKMDVRFISSCLLGCGINPLPGPRAGNVCIPVTYE